MVLPSHGHPTIYGNYVAPGVAENGGGPWHIVDENDKNKALCGRGLKPYRRYLTLHVCHLECVDCMKLGGEIYEKEGRDE